MNKIKTLVWFASLVLLMQACYPGGPSYVEDYDIVHASKVDDSVYDFAADSNKAKVTYVLPDTIIDITDPDEVKDPPKISSQTRKLIIDQVEFHMANYGYTQNDTSEWAQSDYIVLCQRLITENYITYFWGGWGGYYPGWGWGYYPPYWGSSTYNYQTGTLFITMIDVAASDTVKQEFFPVWDAGVNGLLGTTTATTNARIESGISTAFSLSTYLKKN